MVTQVHAAGTQLEVRRGSSTIGRTHRLLADRRNRVEDHNRLRITRRTARATRRQARDICAGGEVLIHHIGRSGIRRAAISKTPMPIRNRAGASIRERHSQRYRTIRRCRGKTRHRLTRAEAGHPVRGEATIRTRDDNRICETGFRERREV